MKNVPLFNFADADRIFFTNVFVTVFDKDPTAPYKRVAALPCEIYGSFADCGKWPVFAPSCAISMHCLILLDFLSSVGALLLLLFFADVYWTRYVF